MKSKLLWFVIVLLIVIFTPTLPYEREMQSGVVRIEYRSLFEAVKERYEKVQKRMGVVSPEVPEVPREDVDAKGKHVQ